MLIERLTIIGVGLIGGSLASALKATNVCQEVVGCGRNVENLQTAIDMGVIDSYQTDPTLAVQGADMVVVAVPLGTMAKIFTTIHDYLLPTAIITDVGSAKFSVNEDAKQLGKHFSRFVPGHPIAGREQSGVAASIPDLFKQHVVILTPTEVTDAQATEKVTNMWAITGAEVINMSIAHHDSVLAATSHLPHVIAYNLVDTLAAMDAHTEIFQFAAGGFRDFTRIASSDPVMWHDICLANQTAILEVLDEFNADLTKLATAIRENDSQTIMNVFKRAKKARDNYLLQRKK